MHDTRDVFPLKPDASVKGMYAYAQTIPQPKEMLT